ncbi:hypothetical protein, partial [Photobacterium halotolerans]|uniref:hypothetical protein n=1 Tax=Photobacterium halotolerans TaxID=265726 RepID=UPI001F30DC91
GLHLPQEKIQDEFLGCRRRERLQPPRTTPENKKGISGYSFALKEYLARIKQCQISHRTQCVTYSPSHQKRTRFMDSRLSRE